LNGLNSAFLQLIRINEPLAASAQQHRLLCAPVVRIGVGKLIPEDSFLDIGLYWRIQHLVFSFKNFNKIGIKKPEVANR
jgi:hypothetical protein